MKVLNLYAGIGGNRKLWQDVQVTAVEQDPDIAQVYSDFYPEDKIIIGDAHNYLLQNFKHFDFIWSSPPCPTHSRLSNSTLKGHGIYRYPDMKLYQEIIFLKHFSTCQWVVENVKSYYTPLITPIEFHRHYFWSNFIIRSKNIKNPIKGLMNSVANEPAAYQKILGINLAGISLPGTNKKRTVLRNCVLPELGKHIFDCAMDGHIS